MPVVTGTAVALATAVAANTTFDLNRAWEQQQEMVDHYSSEIKANFSMTNPRSWSVFTRNLVAGYQKFFRIVVVHDRSLVAAVMHPALVEEGMTLEPFDVTMVRPLDPLGLTGHTTYKVFLISKDLHAPDGETLATITVSNIADGSGDATWNWGGPGIERESETVLNIT
jgi:hypothetical protein